MANKVYRAVETAITFKDSGGDAAITLQALGYGTGRISARYDRGSGSKPARYRWKAVMQFDAGPEVGSDLVELYLAESDGTYVDGNVGTADAVMATDKRRNLKLFGLVVADMTSASTDIVASGIVWIYERYFSVGVWNAADAENLKNTANTCLIIFTPMPDEIQ